MTSTRTLTRYADVAGTVGWTGRRTLDGREIAGGALTLPEEPIPLLAIRQRAGVGAHDGQVLVGALESVRHYPGNGAIAVTGWCDTIAPGRYPCGLDLAGVQSELTMADGAPWSWARIEAGEEVLERIVRGRIAGVTLYLPASGQRPAFPGAELLVMPR